MKTKELPPLSGLLVDTFCRSVSERGETECWPWLGRVSSGYPVFTVLDGTYQACRIAYSLVNGLLPVGCVVRHTCPNSLCMNPAHLVLRTVKEHAVRRPEGTPVLRGSDHGGAKVTEDAVRDIRANYKAGTEFNVKYFRRKYGIRACTLYSIVSRRSWKHVQ